MRKRFAISPLFAEIWKARDEQAELRRQASLSQASRIRKDDYVVEEDNFLVGEDASGVGTAF